MLPKLPKKIQLQTVDQNNTYFSLTNKNLNDFDMLPKKNTGFLQQRYTYADRLINNLELLGKFGNPEAKDKQKVMELIFKAKKHLAFYKKLIKYKSSKEPHVHGLTLKNVFNPDISGADKDIFFKKDGLYTTVTKAYGAEKMDPLHRQHIRSAYDKWLKRNLNKSAGVDSFVEFCLISADDPGVFKGLNESSKRVPNSTVLTKHYELTFVDGKAYTDYYETPEVNRTKLKKLIERSLYLDYLAKSHLFHTRVNEFNINDKTYILEHYSAGGDRLPWSFLYAMRKNKQYAYPETGSSRHPTGVDHKAIQVAGHIVSEKGKIVAIDNNSGHYSPEWDFLRQAVELISDQNAFHEHAVVGVYYPSSPNKLKSLYLPVAEFLYMATRARLFDVDWIKSFLQRVKAGAYQESEYYKIYLKQYELEPTDENALKFADDMRTQRQAVVGKIGKRSVFQKNV